MTPWPLTPSPALAGQDPANLSAVIRGRHISLGGVVWIVIGIIVASTHHFFKTLHTASTVPYLSGWRETPADADLPSWGENGLPV
jgi:hypothetical protein